MRHVIERHKYTLAIGLPIVILLASTTLSFSRNNEILDLDASDRFLAVGATTTIDVLVTSTIPINAVGGSVILPEELNVMNVSTEDTVVDLWTHEPEHVEGMSVIDFSGGIITKDGFSGSGTLFSFEVEATKSGRASLIFDGAQILAHDGQGTNVLDEGRPATLLIRSEGLGLVSRKLFSNYNPAYDFNSDGKVSFADLFILVSLLNE